jgi:hypothetical protein
MFQPTNPEYEKIVQALVDALAAVPVGDTLAYIVANKIAGRDIQKRSRYLLIKAQARAEKQYGCIFESIRSVGIKRLNASDAPEVGLAAIRGVRRKAKRGARRLSNISSNSQSDPERKRTIAYSSLLGTIAMMADGNKARTIAAVIDPAKPIPPKDILQMFT